MHSVGGGITVGENEAAVFIDPAPIVTIGCKAVHRIKGRSGIGVHIARMRSEGAAEVEADQCAAFLVIAWEYDVIIRNFVIIHTLAQAAVLGGLAAAVDALEHDQFSLSHGFVSFTRFVIPSVSEGSFPA